MPTRQPAVPSRPGAAAAFAVGAQRSLSCMCGHNSIPHSLVRKLSIIRCFRLCVYGGRMRRNRGAGGGGICRHAQLMCTRAPPSTGSATPVMKFASSEARNSAALATSQAVPILWRSGTRASRAGGDFGAALAAGAGAGIDRHRRVHQSRQDDVGADAVFGVLDGELLGEGDQAGLGRLVGDVGILLPGGDRRDGDDDARALRPHHREHVLACHDRAAQVDGRDAVEGLLGDLIERRIAAGDAHARHCNASTSMRPQRSARGLDHRGERAARSADVGRERRALRHPPARPSRRSPRRTARIVVDGEHLGAFLREAQHGGAAVAHAFAGRLAGPDHDGDLVLETHAATSAKA